MMDTVDCILIGGGPGGLMTAVYLARFKRSCVVLDAGNSRLRWIPKTRNVVGFPDGIAGPELLDRIRRHAAGYEVPVHSAQVRSLSRLQSGGFEATDGEQRWRGRSVVLATGARDVEPPVDALEDCIQCALVRYCPICDGFETEGRRVAVLGKWEHGLREAAFVAGFGNEVTWLAMETREALPADEVERLRLLGVRIADAAPRAIRRHAAHGVEVELTHGEVLHFDTLYSALGLQHASQLGTALGADSLDNGQLVVDVHQQTTVPGLYAVGDVSADLNQINVAAGHAAIAATAIHNSL